MKPTIMVPFDFSTAAERALAWAAGLQNATRAAPVQIVHAISARPIGTAGSIVEPLLPNEDEIAGLEAKHGRTGVRRLLLGSVAEHVLRHADCPVVTVQAPRGR